MEPLSTIVAEIEHVINETDENQVHSFASKLFAAPRLFVTGEGRSGLMAKAFTSPIVKTTLVVTFFSFGAARAADSLDYVVADPRLGQNMGRSRGVVF
jgi:6-phospho-3-hexuloisomerase